MPFRPCLPPSRAKHIRRDAPANSTRLIPLDSTGRGFGARVSGKETPDGRPRLLSPAANETGWPEDRAQAELQQYRHRLRVVSAMAFVDWLVGLAKGEE